EGNGFSAGPALSADGRFVAFHNTATNLVAGDTNGKTDVFVHDQQTGTTERVSVASDGTQGNGPSSGAALSADGGLVAFHGTEHHADHGTHDHADHGIDDHGDDGIDDHRDHGINDHRDDGTHDHSDHGIDDHRDDGIDDHGDHGTHDHADHGIDDHGDHGT